MTKNELRALADALDTMPIPEGFVVDVDTAIAYLRQCAEAGPQINAALTLLKRIRYHAERHSLPREWLTAADEVLGTWGPVILTHQEAQPAPEHIDPFSVSYAPAQPAPERCSLDVGCDEAGICYARANGHPEQCPREPQP